MKHQDLLERIEHLESLEIARNHVFSYANAVDACDAYSAGRLFAEDAVLSVPSGEVVGQQDIIDFYRSRVTGVSRRHFITNVRPAVTSSGEIQVESYFFFTGQERGQSGLGWGVYSDLIRVENGLARFIKKSITPVVDTTLKEGWPL